MAPPRITFVTPTYKADLERFYLQRESIERCGITVPHLAVVNHEDLPAFRAIPFQANLTLVSTRDVLPRRFEAQRAACLRRRRDPRHWLAGPTLPGWMAQQLVKLAAASLVDTESYVCLDSDTFFVGPVTDDNFFDADGRLHLYETSDDLDAEMTEWYVCSLRFLGVPTRDQPLFRYIHSPVPLHRQVVLNMQAFIEKRFEVFWMAAMMRHPLIYEYPTYGVFARHLDCFAHVVPTRPALSLYYWFPHQTETLAADFLARRRQTGAAMALIHSNIGLDAETYRPLARAAWEEAGV